MKKTILCISDTHNKHKHIPKEDLLVEDPENSIIIHAGDISSKGEAHEIKNFLDWFSNLNFKYKIFIAGNHDFGFETNDDIEQIYKDKGVIYLMDRMVEVDGLKIYGSPWQPRFYDWAFNVDRGEAIAQKWAKIPNDLDILITHGPAFGILDVAYSGIRCGCEDLYNRIFEVNPKIHVFGHIHFDYGMKEFGGTTFINASVLDESYEYRNKPIIVDLN